MTRQPTTMGAFAVRLAVKNIQASREVYEKLGFEVVFGEAAQQWLILRNACVPTWSETVGAAPITVPNDPVHVRAEFGPA